MIKLKNFKRRDFLKILPENSIGAELGVYRGDFSKHIMKVVNPNKLYLIDPWWMLGIKRYPFSIVRQSVVNAYIKVIKYFEDELISGKVVVKVGYDYDILVHFPDDYFDWVYLDASHGYEESKRELEILKHKVKDSGFIAGHDWEPNPNHIQHGLYKAVNEFIENNPYDLAYLDNHTQWCIRKK